MKFEEATLILDGMGIPYLPTGSRFTVTPPVLSTDADIVVLDEVGIEFEEFGFKMTSVDSDLYEPSGFETYRSGEVNLIVVHDEATFKLWTLATEICKTMNLQNKDKRIKLFKGFLYGNWE